WFPVSLRESTCRRRSGPAGRRCCHSAPRKTHHRGPAPASHSRSDRPCGHFLLRRRSSARQAEQLLIKLVANGFVNRRGRVSAVVIEVGGRLRTRGRILIEDFPPGAG